MKDMPDSMFRKLEGYYNNPSFKPKIVKAGSVAAGSLCMWARAVYEYCIVYRALKPKRMQLKRAESLLQEVSSLVLIYICYMQNVCGMDGCCSMW